MKRRDLIRQIESCRRDVRRLEKLFPHAMRWAVASFPRSGQPKRDSLNQPPEKP